MKCSICHKEIDPDICHIAFSQEKFRWRVAVCGLECMEKLLKNLKEIKVKLVEEKDDYANQ